MNCGYYDTSCSDCEVVIVAHVPQRAKTAERTILLAGQGAGKLTGNAQPTDVLGCTVQKSAST